MKYFVAFAVITAVTCVIADIAFRYEIKKYKEKLERGTKSKPYFEVKCPPLLCFPGSLNLVTPQIPFLAVTIVSQAWDLFFKVKRMLLTWLRKKCYQR